MAPLPWIPPSYLPTGDPPMSPASLPIEVDTKTQIAIEAQEITSDAESSSEGFPNSSSGSLLPTQTHLRRSPPASNHVNLATSPSSLSLASPLLSLPTELLLQVLSYTFTLPASSQPLPLRLSPSRTYSPNQPLTPLLTCRLFYHLGELFFYANNTLRLDSPAQLFHFLTDLSPRRRAAIRSLEVGGLGAKHWTSGAEIERKSWSMLGVLGGLKELRVELAGGKRWVRWVERWDRDKWHWGLGRVDGESEVGEDEERGEVIENEEDDDESEEADQPQEHQDDKDCEHRLRESLIVLGASIRGLERVSVMDWRDDEDYNNFEEPQGGVAVPPLPKTPAPLPNVPLPPPSRKLSNPRVTPEMYAQTFKPFPPWPDPTLQDLNAFLNDHKRHCEMTCIGFDQCLRRVCEKCVKEVSGERRVEWLKAQWKRKRGKEEKVIWERVWKGGERREGRVTGKGHREGDESRRVLAEGELE